VSVARRFFVVDLEILFLLVFINAEVKVGPSLHLLVDVTRKGIPLFLAESFLELEVIELLSDELSDLVLDVLQVVVVLVLYLADTTEYGLLLVDVPETVEPLGLRSLLSLPLDQVRLRLGLLVLVLPVTVVSVDLSDLFQSGLLISLHVDLHFFDSELSGLGLTESAQLLSQLGLFLKGSSEKHI